MADGPDGQSPSPPPSPQQDPTQVRLPIADSLIDSGAYPTPVQDAGTSALTTRTHRLARIAVLLVMKDPTVLAIANRLPTVATDQLPLEVTVVSDLSRALLLLETPGWHAVVLDDDMYGVIGLVKEAERLRLLRHTILITQDQQVDSLAQSMVAVHLPLARLTIDQLLQAVQAVASLTHVDHASREAQLIQDVLWRIVRGTIDTSADLAAILHQLAEAAAHVLNADRILLWQLEGRPPVLQCAALVRRAQAVSSRRPPVPALACPVFCAAMSKSRLLLVRDIAQDHRTRELVPLFADDPVTAVLGVPIFLSGTFAGILLAGNQRDRVWSEADCQSIAQIADQVQLSLLAHQKQVLTQEAQQTRAQLHTAHRMEAVGQLAVVMVQRFRGMVLEIDRHLNACLTYVRTTGQHEIDLTTEIHRTLGVCAHATSLIDQFEEFSRPSSHIQREISLHEIIDQVLALPALKGRTIQRKFLARPDQVLTDRSDLKRFFFFLFTAILSRLGEKDQLGISTYRFGRATVVSLAAPSETFQAIPQDNLLLLSGYALALGIAAPVINSQRAESCMELRFITEVTPPSGSPVVPTGAVTVLIIDDQLPRWSEHVEVLAFFGYQARCLPPDEALRLLSGKGDPVGVVVLSMATTLMNPEHVFRAIRLVMPQLPVVAVGLPGDPLLERANQAGAVVLAQGTPMAEFLRTIEAQLA